MFADYMLIHYVLCLCNIFISGKGGGKFTEIPHPRINVSKMTGQTRVGDYGQAIDIQTDTRAFHTLVDTIW